MRYRHFTVAADHLLRSCIFLIDCHHCWWPWNDLHSYVSL